MSRHVPDVLEMKEGAKVATAAQWPKRRAEILEDFEREVYGRIPANVPKVAWEVTSDYAGNVGGVPIITKTLVGHVDNSAFTNITVNIQASFTVPANTPGPVPVLISFGFGGNAQQALRKGWGYGTYQSRQHSGRHRRQCAASGDYRSRSTKASRASPRTGAPFAPGGGVSASS